MRAVFNNIVTLYDGLTTATPGFPRVVDALCRLVPDDYFVDTFPPLSPSLSYFTIAAAEPRASTNVNVGGGVWTFDFGKSDIVEFGSLPGTFFVITRVELCTWSDPGAPYWRASIVETAPLPPPCSDAYSECYSYKGFGDPVLGEVTRTGTTNWDDGTATLDAEEAAAFPPLCLSNWIFKINGVTYVGVWNGIGVTTLTADDGSGWTIDLGPCL